jgi:plastocyanin
MRKTVLAALLLVLVAALTTTATTATSATVGVQITRLGFVPRNVTIRMGDTVTWTNADTVAHRVVFRQRTGLQCPQPLVIQPAQSGSCTFTQAGRFAYDDPTQRGAGFRGTVTVEQGPLGVTLQAAPRLVTYGGRTTLSGAVSTAQSGQRVDVLAQPCGQAQSRIATVTTTTAGAYTYSAQPLLTTTYQARFRSASSPAVAVRVRPRIRLGKVARTRYSVRVTAAIGFRGRLVYLQRYNATRRTWITVRRAALRTVVAGIAPTRTTSVTIRVRLRAGLRVRVVMPQAQVGACYAPGRSNIIRS